MSDSDDARNITVEVKSLSASLQKSAELKKHLDDVCAELERRIREKEKIRNARVRIVVNPAYVSDDLPSKGNVFYASTGTPAELKESTFPALLAGFDVYFGGAGSFAAFPEVKCVLVKIDFSSSAKSGGSTVPEGDKKRKGDADLASFSATEPIYSFDQIILPEERLKEIGETIEILRNRDLIYNRWGFSEVDPAARAILNFFGPPGTGKTMTAHAIAKKLGVKILAANFAQIESKYVGDAPKNLERAFEAASRENALLFFDEADSFLGKRVTNVQHSSDQALNSLRSNLLIHLESFSGVVVFCTNLAKNYDSAFESRILRHLKFELPNRDARIAILKKHIPQSVPFVNDSRPTDEEFGEIADIGEGLSGREIKNGVLKTLCMVAARDGADAKFSIADFLEGFKQQKEETEKLRKESGKLSEGEQGTLSKQIRENIEKGNYSVKSASGKGKKKFRTKRKR